MGRVKGLSSTLTFIFRHTTSEIKNVSVKRSPTLTCDSSTLLFLVKDVTPQCCKFDVPRPISRLSDVRGIHLWFGKGHLSTHKLEQT